MNIFGQQQKQQLLNFGNEEQQLQQQTFSTCFSKLSTIEQQKVQYEAVAAAAAFLLSFPSNNSVPSKIGDNNNNDNTSNAQQQQQQHSNSCHHLDEQMLLRHSPLRPISQKGNRWVHLGTFQSDEEMHRVRNREKVSKRRTEQLKNGVKIRYRCNTWKRTKCAFQMFSFLSPNTGLIDLYESGEHDHSGRRKLEYDLYGPIRRRHITEEMGTEESTTAAAAEEAFNNQTAASESASISNIFGNKGREEEVEKRGGTSKKGKSGNRKNSIVVNNGNRNNNITKSLGPAVETKTLSEQQQQQQKEQQQQSRNNDFQFSSIEGNFEGARCGDGGEAANQHHPVSTTTNSNSNSSNSSFFASSLPASPPHSTDSAAEGHAVALPYFCSPCSSFSLAREPEKRDQLRAVAAEFGLALSQEGDNIFSFYKLDGNNNLNNNKHIEDERKKMLLLTLIDSLSECKLITLGGITEEEKATEEWRKAGWEQFKWALRGRLLFAVTVTQRSAMAAGKMNNNNGRLTKPAENCGGTKRGHKAAQKHSH